jgi:hypothetical protein
MSNLEQFIDRNEQARLGLSDDDAVYLQWAREIGFNLGVEAPNTEPENEDDYVPDIYSQIDDWFDPAYGGVLDELWKAYVPQEGASNVLQGELARCISRLEREYWRNGMMNLGSGYYEDMADLIRDTVQGDPGLSPLVRAVLELDVSVVKGADYRRIVGMSSIFQQTDVERSLSRLRMLVSVWCKARPDPIEFKADGAKG